MLVLSLTDQLAEGHGQLMHEVRDVLTRVTDPYQRAYYTGISTERAAELGDRRWRELLDAPERAVVDLLARLRRAVQPLGGHRLGERRRPGQFLVGFAAETDDVEEAGREKLRSKHLDALVANAVGRDGTGFGSETNEATILVADGGDVPMHTWSKEALASAVCDLIGRFLTGARPAGTLGRP